MKGPADATPRRLARNPLTVPAAAPRPSVAPLPENAPTARQSPPAAIHRGLSLRPKDVSDPYAWGRFAPDQVGIMQLTVWCPHCNGCLLVVEVTMTDAGLFVEGVCQTCSNPAGARPGIYKRLLIPLRWGSLPLVEE
jgi:hypothetical protein